MMKILVFKKFKMYKYWLLLILVIINLTSCSKDLTNEKISENNLNLFVEWESKSDGDFKKTWWPWWPSFQTWSRNN